MPVQTSYPGLYIEELPNLVRTITAAPTSITVFVGYVHPFQGECADKELWGKPIRIFTFDDYERVFGGLFRNQTIGRGDVAYAVYQFFLNGGSDAYVIGLQPKFFEHGGNREEDIVAAKKTLSGIEFVARELTDDAHKLTVTLLNVRTSTTDKDTADLIVTYGRHVETLRGVRVGSSAAALAHGDYIETRLKKESRLVTLAAGGGPYAKFSLTGTAMQERVELVDMEVKRFGAGAAATAPDHFHAEEFIEVFKDKGALDKVDIFNLLVIPGVSDLAVLNAGLAFCEKKHAFFIIDAPEQATTDSIPSMLSDGALPTTPASGALYYPFLNVPDPLGSDEIHLPPSGAVAGIYARTDTRRGVWKAPAGFETAILNTRGVVERGRMTDMEQGVLNRLGVNVLRSFPGAGTVVWGARTIVTDSPAGEQWRYVPVRRTALFIEQTLLRNLGWAVFEPNDEPLWTALRISVEGFMFSLFNQGAFQGRTPSEAFMVKCDKTTTSQTDINNGTVNLVVGFRPLKPAEFVIIKIAQLAGQAQA